jgi:hypothetical protein
MKNYLEDFIEHDHKLLYNHALKIAGVKGPAWEKLTEQQRTILRNLNLVQIRTVNSISLEFLQNKD